jgi:hypothetical protein
MRIKVTNIQRITKDVTSKIRVLESFEKDFSIFGTIYIILTDII